MMMKKIDFWVWSRGLSIKRSTKVAPAQINHPIIMGNVLVNPGDLVFADNDGVAIVPMERAQEIYDLATGREGKEAELIERVKKDGTAAFNGNAVYKATFEKLGLSEEP